MREKGSPKEFFAAQEDLNHVSPNGAAAVELEEENESEVVRTKQFNLKPMDSEEAILQMDLLGHSFFVFTDAETNATNIVYKRRDGKYGLIETN
uniref:sigma 54 modulation/S30EA ribosomal C-terminal domain-containing protein n=1 Tax=Bacillus haikouensis TaxID=1510468 RepID=UPI0035E40672